MKRGTPNHPKTHDLAALLGVRHVTALGHLELLFHFTSQYAPEGNIGKYSDKRIAAALEWPGSPAKLTEALTTSGWVDPDDRLRLVVHDWSDHIDRTTLQRLSRHGKKPVKGNHVDTEKVCNQNGSNICTHPPTPTPTPTTTPTPTQSADVCVTPPSIQKPVSRWDGFELERWLERLMSKHPRKGYLGQARIAARQRFTDSVDPLSESKAIEKRHEAWVLFWSTREPRFKPYLHTWLSKPDCMEDPPQIVKPMTTAEKLAEEIRHDRRNTV